MLILVAPLLVLAAAPLSAAGRAPRPASANAPARIAFGMFYVDGTDRGQIVTLRPDGRGGVRQLVPGMHNQSFCQSADGRKIAYSSDQEAPHEQFIYVANADGSQPEKITEKQVGFVCPFSGRWLLLFKQVVGSAVTIIRHDLQSGAEKTVVTNVARYALSPDGSKLLFVGGLDYTPVQGQLRPKGKETLELLNLTTLERRRLAGPLARARGYYPPSCGCFGWSPDGRRIAYAIGPSSYADRRWAGQPQVPPRAHPYAVYVQPVAGGAARRVLRFSGGPPSISWSSDGRRLLVCAQNRASWRVDEEKGCSGGIPRPNGTYFLPRFAGKLLLVDLGRGSVRRVASGKKLLFAQWAPSGQTFAYATTAAAYVARPGGARRLLALASGRNGHWPGGGWMGWSPDGRYVGLGSFSSHLAVINAATGRVRVLFKDRKDEFQIMDPRWWR